VGSTLVGIFFIFFKFLFIKQRHCGGGAACTVQSVPKPFVPLTHNKAAKKSYILRLPRTEPKRKKKKGDLQKREKTDIKRHKE